MSKKKKQNTTKYAGSAFAVILAALLSYFPISKQLNKQETVNETQKQEVVINQDQQQDNDISLEEAVVSVQNLEIPAKLKDRSEKILKRSNYTISYNRNWNQPNWVAWELNKNETRGRNNRNEEFTADPDLAEAYQVESYDYSGSGYDRGHMCPAGDNHFDAKAMNESFYMSNICPQNPSCIFDVPIIDKRNGKRIGKEHEIIVPEKFFKVILITSTKPARAIGYIFENNGSDRPYKVHSIDEVEKITGMDFFPNLPDKIEDLVESRYEASDWRWYN